MSRDELKTYILHRNRIAKYDHDCPGNRHLLCVPVEEYETEPQWTLADGTPVTDPAEIRRLNAKLAEQGPAAPPVRATYSLDGPPIG